MGTGDSWGTREEFLHPRDSHGRFRKSWKMTDNVISRISDFLSKFNPVTFGSDGQAGQYAFNLASKKPGRFAGGEDLHRLRMDMGHANHALRLGQNDPSTTKFVQMMDREKISAPNDMILSRVTTPEAFGLHADTGDQIQELTGKQLADRGYGAARLGTPLAESIPGQPRVLMTIAVPKGTQVVVPGEGRDDRRVFLDKGQNLRITKVKSDGQGGYYVLAVAEPGSSNTPEPMRQLAPSDVTSQQRESRIAEAKRLSLRRMTGPPPEEEQAQTPASVPTSEAQAPSTPSPTPSTPSPVTPEAPAAPNLGAEAVARQAEINRARSVADSAGRVHEMIGNGETRPEVLRRVIQAQVKQNGLPQETATEWSNAADKPGDLSALLAKSEQAAGLTRIGEPGQSAKFNGKLHQNIGEATQGPVDVVRPGYSFKTSKGEDVQISRAVVEPTVNAPAPKAATSETPATPKTEVPTIQVPAEINKASIPALREAAAKAGIRVPASAKTKAQIVNHILTEMVKGEAVKRGIAKPEAPKEPKTPKLHAVDLTPEEIVSARSRGDISRAEAAKELTHRADRMRVSAAYIHKDSPTASTEKQQFLKEADRLEAMAKQVSEARRPAAKASSAPKAEAPKAPATPSADVTKMTIPQLRAHAKEQGIKIPSSITRKADIVAHIQSGGKPSAPKSGPTATRVATDETGRVLKIQHIGEKATSIAKISPHDQAVRDALGSKSMAEIRRIASDSNIEVSSKIRSKAAAIDHIVNTLNEHQARTGRSSHQNVIKIASERGATPTDVSKMTIPQLRAHAREQGIKIPSSIMRKADIVAYVQGSDKAGVVVPFSVPSVANNVADQLGKVSTEAQGRKILEGLGSKAAHQELAKKLGIEYSPSDSVGKLREDILRQSVTRRLEHEAYLKRANPVTGGEVKSAISESVPLKGDPEGDNMRMHGDSLTMQLAQQYAKAGRNGSANRMMELRRQATTSSDNGISPQKVIDELRSIRSQETDPVFQRRLDRTIEELDSPKTPVPSLPSGTPPSARKLIEDLNAIPYARKSVRGQPSLVDQLAEVYRNIHSERTPPQILISRILRDKVHESNEASFRIWALEGALRSHKDKDGNSVPSVLDRELRDWRLGKK